MMIPCNISYDILQDIYSESEFEQREQECNDGKESAQKDI